jgi:hypothetical protein
MAPCHPRTTLPSGMRAIGAYRRSTPRSAREKCYANHVLTSAIPHPSRKARGRSLVSPGALTAQPTFSILLDEPFPITLKRVPHPHIPVTDQTGDSEMRLFPHRPQPWQKMRTAQRRPQVAKCPLPEPPRARAPESPSQGAPQPKAMPFAACRYSGQPDRRTRPAQLPTRSGRVWDRYVRASALGLWRWPRAAR